MPAVASLEEWLCGIAPPESAVAVGPIGPVPCCYQDEETILQRAAPGRRDEFRTGRALARRALAGLGCAACAIPADSERVPVWPPGYLGSITHGAGLCAAGAGRAGDFVGIGMDVEAAGAVDPTLADIIATPDEWAELGRLLPPAEAAAVCFSAKEAFYKAYFPAARVVIGFHDVRVQLDSTCTRFEASLATPEAPGLGGRRRWRGEVFRTASHVAAAVWIRR